MKDSHTFAFVTTDSNGDHDVLFIKVTSDTTIEVDQINDIAKQAVKDYENDSELSDLTREDCIVNALTANNFTVSYPVKQYTTIEVN